MTCIQSVLVGALYGESYDLLYNTYRDHHLVPHCSESGDCSDDQEDCVLQNLDGDVTGCETSGDRSSTIVTKSVSVDAVSGHPDDSICSVTGKAATS